MKLLQWHGDACYISPVSKQHSVSFVVIFNEDVIYKVHVCCFLNCCWAVEKFRCLAVFGIRHGVCIILDWYYQIQLNDVWMWLDSGFCSGIQLVHHTVTLLLCCYTSAVWGWAEGSVLPKDEAARNKTKIFTGISHLIGWLNRLACWTQALGFRLQPWCCLVTVLGKLCTPIVPLFTTQRNW